MYRFAVSPRWVLSHLFALAVVVLFVNLGLWQLRRHEDRAARNAVVAARVELPPAPVGELLGELPPDELQFRAATAAGEFEARDLLVDNRSADGLPGVWVLTALVQPDGSTLVVNRGFEGFASGELTLPDPPEGRVEVAGRLVPWSGSGCGSRTGDDGSVVGMACLDRATAEEAFGAAVLPVVLQDASPTSALLRPVPLPEPGAGPHRSYAVQWFIFATIVTVVYALILRKVARDPERLAGDLPSGQ